jgi:hypothetical protein
VWILCLEVKSRGFEISLWFPLEENKQKKKKSRWVALGEVALREAEFPANPSSSQSS